MIHIIPVRQSASLFAKIGAVIITLFLFQVISTDLIAQTPTIEGELVLCPFGSSILSTQEFDEYQWYKREYFGDESFPLEGEINQTLEVTSPEFTVVYVKVVVTLDGVEYASEEVLVDEWVFQPVFVQTTGEFTIGAGGVTILEPGNTVYFTVFGIGAEIKWYRNDILIPNETGTTLAVTEAGIYYVTGTYGQCPDYPTQGSLPLEVIVNNPNSIGESFSLEQELKIWPNPTNDFFNIDFQGKIGSRIRVFDMTGRIVNSINGHNFKVSLEGLQPGYYHVIVELQNGSKTCSQIVKL